MNTSVALRTEGLSKSWGSFKANSDIGLSLSVGARHALIGPNGAGKTTFINLITGTFAPTSGDVFVGRERVTHLGPSARVAKGIARTFQINTLFPGLNPLESVTLAILEREGLTRHWFRPVTRHHQAVDEAMALIEDLGLAADAARPTRSLAYGRQRLLEIALALALKPKILLLDEPAAGIPTGESDEMFNVIARLPRDVTILFIEHDMNLVFRFAERITVLVAGRVLTEGTPSEIMADARVREVYLGEAQHV